MFVRWYYSWSPAAAQTISESEVLKLAVRAALMPLFALCWMLFHFGAVSTGAACLGIAGLGVLVAGARRKNIKEGLGGF